MEIDINKMLSDMTNDRDNEKSLLAKILGSTVFFAVTSSAAVIFCMSYLVDIKQAKLDKFIVDNNCKAYEVVKIDNFETNIIYRCNDGEEVQAKL
jgi:hypothetical protein